VSIPGAGPLRRWSRGGLLRRREHLRAQPTLCVHARQPLMQRCRGEGEHDRSGGGRGGRPAKEHRMRIRPPSRPRRAVATLAVAFLVLAAACTPGGSNDNKSSSGPVTLKLQANAVKGGKNATEASWLQDWVIPNFQKQMTDQGRKVTVQYVGTGADDEDVKTQLALTCAPAAGPTCSPRTAPGWGNSPRPGSSSRWTRWSGPRSTTGTAGRRSPSRWPASSSSRASATACRSAPTVGCCTSTRSCSPRPACPATGSPRAGTRPSRRAAS
jgi:hypothetical protein